MPIKDFLIDPYNPQAAPAHATPELDEDISDVPTPAVTQPWFSAKGKERGEALQAEATTGLTEQFRSEPYDVPEGTTETGGYNPGPSVNLQSGQRAPKSNVIETLGRGAGMTALQSGIGLGVGSVGGGAAGAFSQAAFNNAIANGMGETAAMETGRRAGAQAAGSTAGATASGAMIAAGAAYGGYTMGPAAAGFEAEYMGGYSPGYVGAGVTTPIFQASGSRTDKEAKQQRGQRIGSMGAGATMGAGSGAAAGSVVPGLGTAVGATIGAIAGAVGGFFSENPATGKRGYQETWKYDIKPAGIKMGKDINMKAYGDMFKGKFSKDIIPGTNKEGFFRNLTNWKGWKDALKSTIPGMGGMGGGGKKPPPQSQIRGDIQDRLAGNVNLDYQIQEWWNTVADEGAGAGREYIKGGLQTEGREWGTDEALPSWTTEVQEVGKKNFNYQYGPEEIAGRRVASERNVGTLSALQNKMEEGGSRKKFWQSYMEDYNMWGEGGAGLSDKWHGKRLYQLPSEVSGLSPTEMWEDIDFGADYNDLDWLRMEEEEEGV